MFDFMGIMICLNNDIDIKMILLNNYYDQDTSGAGVMLGKVYTSPIAESRLVPEWCLQKSFDYFFFILTGLAQKFNDVIC